MVTRTFRPRIVRGLSAAGLLALAVVLGCAARSAQAGDHCFYRGTMFSDGAGSCQAGTQYRCSDGEWSALGVSCNDGAQVASRACQYGGISFSTGSASCQAGMQYRCEDGSWRSLSTPCTLGDSPVVKVVPGGRTCMFDTVTVASSSTICKSGTTYLCNDGEWVNMGTLCR